MAQNETDICVIGSGVAGAIIAQECVEAGRKVLMLEAGKRVKGSALILRLIERMIRDYRIPRMRLWYRGARYRKIDYRTVGNPGYDLRGAAVNARGGSTLGWIGTAYRLKPEDFRMDSSIGRGLDWPISYEELEPYYKMSEKTLRVAGNHLDKGHPPRSTPFPIPARPFHTRDKPFLDLLSFHGWPSMHHNISLAPDGSAFTVDLLLDKLEKRSNFRLLTRNVATRILCSSKKKATAVECRNVNRNELFTIEAESVVVCAGGIETPNLLRRSANEWWPDGLGNHSGHLGRHLISHSGIGIGGRPQGLRLINGPIGSTAVTRYFDSEKEQALGKYMLLWYPMPTGYLFFNVTMEQFPSENNTVSLGSTRTRFGTPLPIINFNHNKQLKEREIGVLEHLKTLGKHIGLRISYQRHYVNAHPMCASRMSTNPCDGVTDRELLIHFMDNVYVCSSASFTTGGAANPTLTIAALAHRLGRYLSKRML
jgi:choline dehydrogenase-like flavoprotein